MKTVITCLAALILLINTPLLAEDTIKIGWIGPLTGNAAVLGMDGAPAARLALDEINERGGVMGRKLELVVEDDQYFPAKTLSAYQKLVHVQGIKILMVVSYSGLFAVAKQAEKDGVILIDPLDCDELIGALPRNVICIAKISEDLGYRLADEIVRTGKKPLAVLYYDGDAFMGVVAKALMERVRSRDPQPVLSLTYDDNTPDFKPLLLKIKESAPKAVVLLGYDTLGTAFKQSRELGIAANFYGLSTLTSPGGLELAQGAAEGATIALWYASDTPARTGFLAKLEKRIGRKPLPDVFVVPPYDVMHVIAEILGSGGFSPKTGRVDAAKALDLLYSAPKFEGLSGSFSIDSKGMARGFNEISIRKVKDGRLEY